MARTIEHNKKYTISGDTIIVLFQLLDIVEKKDTLGMYFCLGALKANMENETFDKI